MSRAGWCRHFNGVQNKTCRAGVDYETVNVVQLPDGTQKKSLPCIAAHNHAGAVCPKREEYTALDLAEQEAQHKRTMDLLARGLSSCCEAPLNTSQVIQSGRHKGHGPRFCSACGKCVFIV